jgi:Ni,Fe-hydrogenase III small subunit
VYVYVCGCGTRPEQIIDGVVQALAILEKKTKTIEESVKLKREVIKEGKQINRRNIAAEIIVPQPSAESPGYVEPLDTFTSGVQNIKTVLQ